MNVLIVEDETAAYENLVDILMEVAPDIQIAGNTESVTQTVHWLQSNPAPELIFMDIHLSDGSAFNIFDKIELEKVKDLEFSEPVIENGKLKVNATNNTSETQSAVLIVASYENGVMKSVSVSDETDISQNGTTLETNAPETNDYKVMVWDSLNTMQPLK